MTSRALLLVLAGVALASAVVLGLLARDVQRWRNAVETGDTRFQLAPGAPRLWRASERVPYRAARRLLAIDDDLSVRRAIYLFRLGRTREPILGRANLLTLRSAAQAELTRVVERDDDLRRRSEAANLLGVLSLVEEAESPTGSALSVDRAIARFFTAVAQDEANDSAKFNLELALRISNRQRAGRRGNEGGRLGRPASGAGTRSGGSGY